MTINKNSLPLPCCQEFSSSALETQHTASGDNLRTERTPGAVAVSGINREGGLAVALQLPPTGDKLSGIPETNSSPLPPTTALDGLSSAYYLESVDKVCNWLQATCDKERGYFVWGECADGHAFAKELCCAKEWCSTCGADGSNAHLRRVARWLPRVMQMPTMGYFVFTLPRELEAAYRSKDSLTAWGHGVQQMLRKFGYERGLRRLHFFGDRSPRWRPHLNVLVDGAFLSPEVLDDIKAAYARLLGVAVADVNYHYRATPGAMIHTLKYVTRATFRQWEWDPAMAQEIHGLRNMVVWGLKLWDKPTVWSLDMLHGEVRAELEGLGAVSELVKHQCPVCHKTITWHEAIPLGLLKLVDKVSMGAGYWRLNDIPAGRAGSPPVSTPHTLRQLRAGATVRGILAQPGLMVPAASVESLRIASYQAHVFRKRRACKGIYDEEAWSECE